jgi:16S rRNA processing protein RimM
MESGGGENVGVGRVPGPAETNEDRVLVGEITAPFGVRGEVKMRPLMDRPETLAKLPSVWLRFGDGREEKRRVTAARNHKGHALLTLVGVADMDAAETLRGAEVFIRRDQLPVLPPDAFYESDLIGLAVVTESGRDLGTIERVHFNPAANDVYETEVALIPAVEAVVLQVNLAARRLLVREMPGLRKDE